MPIEWVGESLSSAYTSGDTRPVDPSDRSQANRDRQKRGQDQQGSFRNPYRQSIARAPQRIEKAVYAKEIMQTRVQTVKQGDPLAVILSLIATHGINHIPVLDPGNKLAGLVSYRSILEAISEKRTVDMVTVPEVMTTKFLTATGNTTLHELSRVMVVENIECVPIVDNAQKLIGLITTAEMMQCIVNHSKLNVWI
ncbi:MAG: CBS domain-containing protein [Bacteroidota bacterium]